MKKTVACLGPVLAIVLVFSAAFALPYRICRGKPNFTVSSDFGYFLWHDDEGFHLRWTTKSKTRRFTGVVSSDSAISDIGRVQKESSDWVKRDGQKSFTFDTTSVGKLDGVRFRTSGKELSIRLMLDGHLIDVRHIHIGATGAHPRSNPFPIVRE